MYATSAFLNRPLLCISDGRILGTVVNFVFDEKVKNLTHLIVGKGENYFLVPVALILKKESDALVAADSSGFTPLDSSTAFLNPVKLPVYGTSGTMTDKVTLVRFDEKFRVKEIQGELRCFMPKEIVSASPDALIIKDCKIARKKTANPAPVRKTVLTAGKLILPSVSTGNFNFLLGRKVDKTILDRENEILVKMNGVITSDILRRARLSGKLLELSLHAVK